eukprot:2631667-Rhodomonas_salina.1
MHECMVDISPHHRGLLTVSTLLGVVFLSSTSCAGARCLLTMRVLPCTWLPAIALTTSCADAFKQRGWLEGPAFLVPAHAVSGNRMGFSKAAISVIPVRRALPVPSKLKMSAADGNVMRNHQFHSAIEFAKAHFLPIGLLTAIIVGLLFPAPGIWLSQHKVTSFAVPPALACSSS